MYIEPHTFLLKRTKVKGHVSVFREALVVLFGCCQSFQGLEIEARKWKGHSGYSIWHAFIWEDDFSTTSAFVALLGAVGAETLIWVILVQWQKHRAYFKFLCIIIIIIYLHLFLIKCMQMNMEKSVKSTFKNLIQKSWILEI